MEWTRVADADDARRWHTVKAAANSTDFVALPADPLAETLALVGFDGSAGSRHELWLRTVDGVAVCAVQIDLPTIDNLDEAQVDITVPAARRRRGHGLAALRLAAERCQTLGRSRLLAQVPGRLDAVPTAGQGFAAATGFAEKLAEVRRLLDLTEEVDLPALEAAAWPHADGYALQQWVERAPRGLHAGLAALAGRMSTDAPQGGLSHAPEAWDAVRWAATEQRALASGRLMVGTLALRGAEVVAYTTIGVSREEPEVGYQWDTIVRADHRGHRLGLLCKAANLRLLRERSPATRRLNTWNAASNTYMISINEAVGFRPVDTWGEWERSL